MSLASQVANHSQWAICLLARGRHAAIRRAIPAGGGKECALICVSPAPRSLNAARAGKIGFSHGQ